MKTLTVTMLIFLNLTTTPKAQTEPLDIAKKIFARDSFANIDKYVTGEYKGRPNGQDLQAGSITRFILLEQNDNKAVVSMTILDSTGKGFDTYLHFTKDTTWKMSAFRALAMTGIIEQASIELEKMTLKQVDELIEKSKKDKNKDSEHIFSSREDYFFELGNSRLTIDLDENIIKHFKNNRAEFERIKDSALKELNSKKQVEERTTNLAENLKNDYRKLFISSVSFGDYELGGAVLSFLIGGILDNTVGFLYVKDKKDLPEMSDDRIIMIREIGDGWYIYKTT